ncbi:hypothetical protein G9A89_007299 [Geosiphon pyriformis]|nr:hypothetical protein G9A89_007299 [Geosiphon pyriformis]
MINLPPVPLNTQQQQQPQLLPQQQIQQQPQPNLDLMAYTPIAKLEKFTGKKNNTQNYLSLLVTTEDTQPNNLETNQQPILTSNILPATITENKSLDTIFPFKLKELLTMLLFSEAALEEKSIMAMYTDVKVDGHSIKLILDSELAGSIITKQLMDQLSRQVDCAASARIITADGATKTPIGEINNFSIEVNDIMVPIKVLIMEATQYQALVENDWLSKTNALLDWNMQELQISQNNHQLNNPTYQIRGRGKETYLRSLSSFLGQHRTQQAAARKQSKELTWKADQAWETDNNQKEQINWEWKEDKKGKGKRKKEEPTTDSNTTYNFYTTPH